MNSLKTAEILTILSREISMVFKKNQTALMSTRGRCSFSQEEKKKLAELFAEKNDINQAAVAFFNDDLNKKENNKKHTLSTIKKRLINCNLKKQRIKEEEKDLLNYLRNIFYNDFTKMSKYLRKNCNLFHPPSMLCNYFNKLDKQPASRIRQIPPAVTEQAAVETSFDFESLFFTESDDSMLWF